MIGSLELPTFSKSHHHGAGFQGSPVEAKARREERSWRSWGVLFEEELLAVSCGLLAVLLSSSGAEGSDIASERIKVGEMPRPSTLWRAQNSHMRSGVG